MQNIYTVVWFGLKSSGVDTFKIHKTLPVFRQPYRVGVGLFNADREKDADCDEANSRFTSELLTLHFMAQSTVTAWFSVKLYSVLLRHSRIIAIHTVHTITTRISEYALVHLAAKFWHKKKCKMKATLSLCLNKRDVLESYW
jgi:hypothetical protein